MINSFEESLLIYIPELTIPFLTTELLIILFSLLITNRKTTIERVHFTLFVVYIYYLLYVTIISREVGTDYLFVPELFWTYKYVGRGGYKRVIWQNIFNIILFMPYGYFIHYRYKIFKKSFYMTIVFGLILSFTIEVLQLTMKRGQFEYDDIFHNVLGAILGCMLYKTMCCFKNLIERRK